MYSSLKNGPTNPGSVRNTTRAINVVYISNYYLRLQMIIVKCTGEHPQYLFGFITEDGFKEAETFGEELKHMANEDVIILTINNEILGSYFWLGRYIQQVQILLNFFDT